MIFASESESKGQAPVEVSAYEKEKSSGSWAQNLPAKAGRFHASIGFLYKTRLLGLPQSPNASSGRKKLVYSQMYHLYFGLYYSDKQRNIIPLLLLLFRKGGILRLDGRDDHT